MGSGAHATRPRNPLQATGLSRSHERPVRRRGPLAKALLQTPRHRLRGWQGVQVACQAGIAVVQVGLHQTFKAFVFNEGTRIAACLVKPLAAPAA